MSYQVLARTWRPRTFANLVGQEHVVRALTHALAVQRLHHAYLLTGTRGVGKTTLARILAKAMNCETGVSALPCDACSACHEIDAGRFVDLIEVDAATNTRVDEMRQLLENAVYLPTRGRYKVYVIDEVHMLSNSAFNAMLKTLEEPPEHVKFILATTDPQKIPVTVLSRCLQFNLKQMPQALIAAHLASILDAEGIPAETAALHLLARSAAGSMRDALSLLDQAIAHGGGKVEEAEVREMLGAIDLDHLFAILDALGAGDAPAMLQVAERMATRSLSFDAALQDLASLLTQVQVAQLAPQAVADDLPERQQVLRLANAFDAEFVQLAYQIAIHGRQELPLAPDEHAGFLMTLLRLHAFRPADDGASQAPPDRVTPRNLAGKPGSAHGDAGRARPAGSPSAAMQPGKGSPPPTAAPESDDQGKRSGALSGTTHGAPPQRTADPPAQPLPRSRQSEAESHRPWAEILASLKVTGMARELGQHCALHSVDGARAVLRLAPQHRLLLLRPAQERLQQALAEYFQRPLQLAIEIDQVTGETPADVAQREGRERLERAIAAVEADGFVREVIETFDATLVETSIRPL